MPRTEQVNPGIVPPTQLSGTWHNAGDMVVFLIPDSLRKEARAKEPTGNIYRLDSAFILRARDVVKMIEQSNKNKEPLIRIMVTAARFLHIEDVSQIIDRDTIDYGLLLMGEGKRPKLIHENIHEIDFREAIEAYFSFRKK